jgi:hypothetical protein
VVGVIFFQLPTAAGPLGQEVAGLLAAWFGGLLLVVAFMPWMNTRAAARQLTADC